MNRIRILCRVRDTKSEWQPAYGFRRAVVAMLVVVLQAAVRLPAAPLDWSPSEGYRKAHVTLPTTGTTGFSRLSPAVTGITFTNRLAEDRHLTNQIYLNGSGLAAGDVDGDGWCDLYFCSMDGPNVLYRNLGECKFRDVTAEAGVACPGLDATGAAFADLDGDADADLIVNSVGGGTHVFLNDASGHFRESSRQAPLNPGRAGSSLALGDLDGDGDLDLYVANYRTVTLRDQPHTRFSIRMINGQPVVAAINGRPLTDPAYTNRFNFRFILEGGQGRFIQEENGEPDVLYRNDGTGHFAPVPFTDGTFLDEAGQPLTQPPFDWGLSVMIRDLNGDTAPDIYVVNDFRSPDRMWINTGQGQFRALDRLALRQTCLSAMGMDVADINRDGYDDIFVYDMLAPVHERRFRQRVDIRPEELPPGAIDNRPQTSRNMLQLNRGDGTYAEIAQFAGVEASDWSWTPLFLDVDLDGYEDLLVSNGFERDNMSVDTLRHVDALQRSGKLSPLEQLHLRKLFPPLRTPNLIFRNLGNLRFEEVGEAWGFHHEGVSQGMVAADLDNDGDLDVVINNLNGVAGVYRNNTVAPRIAVRLKGQPPNTSGVGARIVVTGGPVGQSQQLICGGRYCSSDQPMRMFAAGSLTNRLGIEVTWRSGQRTVLANLEANCIYEIDEASASLPPKAKPPPPQPFFEDVSHLIAHTHHEEPFDDFARQPLLPKRLSQLGPGITWFDVDTDGWDDLIIGSGRGGLIAVYRNTGEGGFTQLQDAPFSQPVTRDQTTVLAWPGEGGKTVLLAGSANYEDGLEAGSCVRYYDLTRKVVEDVLPGRPSSTGPLALADIDGDADLDLFVGGRVVAGRYPEPAQSMLFHAANGTLIPDEENADLLATVGLVSGAVFTDLDADGDPDLVLACDWGPVRVFRNDHGRLNEWNPPLVFQGPSALNSQLSTLNHLTGWWAGVATGDFDGDGRLDIVAANWGRNSRYEWVHPQPLLAYYGDLDGNGALEVLEAYESQPTGRVMPLQPPYVVLPTLPFLQERVSNCTAYARMSLDEIYGGELAHMKRLTVNWLDSTAFFNRGDHFEARALPMEAQLAPAFAVCVGDLDGDGNEDLFLSQNFFAVPLETSRCDAGRGLWLRGDGQGGFAAVPGQASGLKIYGEQRGAALSDYDADGRVDLAVSQNAAPTKLFRNLKAQSGLRVRLRGPPSNPQGIGTQLRWGFESGHGPAREIQAGSGYWSCHSAITVLARPQEPARLLVRWPWMAEVAVGVPAEAREIEVDYQGASKTVR